jgi:hypothetical protein
MPPCAASLSLLLFLAAVTAVRGQEAAMEAPSDSLAFALKRQKILSGAPDMRLSAVLEAAEDLARDGFHAEALELVFDLEDTAWSSRALEEFLDDSLPPPGPEDAAPTRGAPPSPARLDSYVRSSFEYDDWDDRPLGGEMSAKLEWRPDSSLLERLTPVFGGSDRRAFLGLSGRGSAFRRMLRADGEVLAEKDLNGGEGALPDRFNAHGLLEAGTRPLGRAISFSLPLRMQTEHHRDDPLGVLSRRSIGVTPAVEALSTDLRRSLQIAWDFRWNSFPSSRPSGYFRTGPTLLANWYGDRFSAEAETWILQDSYRRDTSLFNLRLWDSRAAAYARPWRKVLLGVRLLHSAEKGRYRDTLWFASPAADTLPAQPGAERARYDLEGRSFTAQPVITVDWTPAHSSTLSLAFTRGSYPMVTENGGRELAWPQFADESFRSWKPEATFSVLSRRLFLNVAASYEIHAPSASPYYFQGYSEGAGMAADVSWKINAWAEADFSGRWRKRLDDKPTAGRVEDNLSLSAGFTSRFR